MNRLIKAAASGLTGAVVLTALHETARRIVPNAPRMDILGMRAIAKSMRAAGETPPPRDELFTLTMIGDILSNAAYYSLVGVGQPDTAWRRGALLGAAAGVGGVVLPEPMGLGSGPSARTRQTQAMTVAWYLVGGLAAAAAYSLLAEPSVA